MRITVKLIGSFIPAAGRSEQELEVPTGTTIDALVVRLAVDVARPMIVTRNGHAVAPGDTVEPGDRVVISPLHSGG